MKYIFFIIISILGISACSTKPYVVKHVLEPNPDRSNRIFVASHGWHTGLILPALETESELPFLQEIFGQVPYYEFGWGDKSFYQAEQITSGLAVQAIFWPTDSVMHVVAVPNSPYQYFPDSELIEIKLSNHELHSLHQFIKQSFYRDEADYIIKLNEGIYGDSQFYQAQGNYYLMNTCNKWTAKGLKSAGMDISPTFKLTAGSVMSYLKYDQTRLSHEPVSSQKKSTFVFDQPFFSYNVPLSFHLQ